MSRKLFNDIEEALDYAVEVDHPVQCGVFFDGDKTSGQVFTVFPSRNFKRDGMFSGLHKSYEIWNPQKRKWEPAA